MENSPNPKSHRDLRSSMAGCISKDRISDLPDSIIQHIISFLDVKNAVKTCVLSKRWESLWTLMPNLLFHCESFSREEIQRFASFVDKVLMKYTSSKIEKFALEFYRYYTPKDQLDSWLRFAVNHEVEELCLQFHFHEEEEFEWPDFMYTNCSVKKLTLHSFWLDEELAGFSWRLLKVLTLSFSTLRDDTIRSILTGSPLLESLELRSCKLDDYWSIIDASGTSLRELVIDGYMDDFVYTQLNIVGPGLRSLTVVEFHDKLDFNLVDVSSLVEANMDFYMGGGVSSYKYEKKMLKNLIQSLSHVDKLTIGICYFQKYFLRKAIRARFPTTKRNILEIDMKSTEGYLPGLSALLCSSPALEQLIINLMPPDCDEFKKEDCYVEKPLRPVVKPISIQHLKSVKIMGFPTGSRSRSDRVLAEMVEYLLANAKVLQKLTIYAIAKPKGIRRLFGIMQKLLLYPRASPDAVVLFESNLQ